LRYTINNYYSDDDEMQRHVREFVVLKGERPKDFPKFIGIGEIQMQLGPQVIPRQFSANLQAEDLDEAFENFDNIMDQAAEAAKKDFEKEMTEALAEQQKTGVNKIVIPG